MDAASPNLVNLAPVARLLLLALSAVAWIQWRQQPDQKGEHCQDSGLHSDRAFDFERNNFAREGAGGDLRSRLLHQRLIFPGRR